MKLYGTCVLVVRGVAYVFRHPERSRSASSPVRPASQTQARTGFTGALKTQRRIVHPNDAQNSAGSNYISPIARCQGRGRTSPPAPRPAQEPLRTWPRFPLRSHVSPARRGEPCACQSDEGVSERRSEDPQRSHHRVRRGHGGQTEEK